MTDSTGAIKARYDYDPWGSRTKTSGGLDADFGFTGHYYHAPSNLHLAAYRAYGSTIGRWISRDPIAEVDGLNIYGYVQNNPINDFDPLGLYGANEAYGDWLNIAANGLNRGGLSGYAQAAMGIAGMTAIDFWGARALENNAERSGSAAGARCPEDTWKYGGLAVGQIAFAAGGQYVIGNALYPFYRFIGQGSRAGFGAGTWLTRGPVGSIPYGSVANGASRLQIPTQSAVNSVVRAEGVWSRYIAGPRPASGNPQWGIGGGAEYRVGGFEP
jgi:RHS repeat-associated protein